jgi:hypothetical protein
MIRQQFETNKTVLRRFMELPQGKLINYLFQLIITGKMSQAMYVWIDGTGENVRAKTKTCDFPVNKPEGEKEIGFSENKHIIKL